MKLEELKKLLALAKTAASGAGEILRDSSDKRLEIKEKAPFDLVTKFDLAANEYIRKALLKGCSNSLVMAEEDDDALKTAAKKNRDCTVLWIVDPIDGTTNFAKRVPHVGISIAAYAPQTKEILVGCIYDPWRKEYFTAMKGCGAMMNDAPIAVSSVDKFHFALAATGFSYTRRRSLDNNLAELAPFVKKCLGVRRFGAASLDLAWIACGRLDLYWEAGLRPWDVAAGILLVREAGGYCSNYAKEESTPFDNTIVASNPMLHQKVLQQIKRSRNAAGLK